MEKKKTNADDFSLEKIIGCNSTQPTVLNKPDSISVSNQPGQPDKENRQCETTLPDRSEKKSVSAKQRKTDLAEYKDTFLKVPKITDRKNVFISNSTREMIVGIVRRFGSEKSSVSGFIENLVIHHLEEYREDIEGWKKL